MIRSREFIRQHIMDLPPYTPILPFSVLSEELCIPVNQLIKLDANENPFGCLSEVNEALAEINTLHIYPDPESRKIRELLARHNNISEESIVVGAGTDELIDLIMRVFLDPGNRILNCPPTFGMYDFDAMLNNAEIISVPRNQDFSINIPALAAAVEEHKPKILFLANPNNPDGSIITQDEFQKLVNLPILIVLDEAYIQFSDKARSFISEVSKYPNLIVLQTFSKWAGLAGLRIGFGVSHADLAAILMKVKQPYNVSTAAETAAVVTMQNITIAEQRIKKIIKQRIWLFNELLKIPALIPYPSQANFILCKVLEGSAYCIKEQLRKQGILIRYFNKPGLWDFIRISIGTENQNRIILSALKGIL